MKINELNEQLSHPETMSGSNQKSRRIKITNAKKTVLASVLVTLFAINIYLGSESEDLTRIFRVLSLWSENNDPKPLVSIIVPTLLRDTLSRTLRSLTTQTDPQWEALLGIDLDILMADKSDEEFVEAFRTNAAIKDDLTFFPPIEDKRIRVSLMRGSSHTTHNSAGEVRNKIMKGARGDWLAFVDDDDTLSPCYVEWLKRGIDKAMKESGPEGVPDLVLFRMWHAGWNNTLPYAGVDVIERTRSGISFAMKRELFFDKDISFKPAVDEDYRLLNQVYEQGYKIQLATCAAYFVHGDSWDPASRECSINDESTCEFHDTEVIKYIPGTKPAPAPK